MANTRTNTSSRRAPRSPGAAGLPWVSDLYLDAYLQARDALRRARGAASATSPGTPPPPRTAAS